MKNIVNIVNFIRAVEPRLEMDLVKPMKRQIEIMRENQLTGTFLLQYDALLDPELSALAQDCSDFCEIGLWLEVVQPQVEAAGGVWKGRFPWDWHNDVGFLIGYEPEFRKKLIDVAMEEFKKKFGKYPESVGSWHIDAVSLRYLWEKYHINASCNCRDQVGTDGYTMQGGYYNQAYYPSVNNMFCPANSKETQIGVPVFRMLGSDPIMCYDYQVINYGEGLRGIPTLEPAYSNGICAWSDWFFNEVMNGSGLCFQYTQAGQENSFGWDAMKEGLEYQFPLIKKLQDEGKVEALQLGETGRWFQSQFKETPASTVLALSASNGKDYKGIWYDSKFYRAGLLWDNGVVRLRDIYIFNDQYQEHYLNKRCASHHCEYRNLPVMDGVIYSNEKIQAGIYFTQGQEEIKFDRLEYQEEDTKAIVTLWKGEKKTEIVFTEKGMSITSQISELALRAKYDSAKVNVAQDCGVEDRFLSANISYVSKIEKKENELAFTFDNFEYSVKAKKGKFLDYFDMLSENGEIEILLA